MDSLKYKELISLLIQLIPRKRESFDNFRQTRLLATRNQHRCVNIYVYIVR